MKVAIVGVTGLVGGVMCKVLEEHDFPVTQFIPVASEKSIGKTILFQNKEHKVVSISQVISQKPDLALFSAGASTSLKWASKFSDVGTTVIDNSSAWRMDKQIPLIVPEINAHILTANDKIIANPNCSTIQLVMALAPLHRKYVIKRVVVSTYQSVSGTGVKAVAQLQNERKGVDGPAAYPHEIDMNCLPHCDDFLENRYTKEEMKLVNETRKILADNSLEITATSVRVPVVGGHSESVNVSFEKSFDIFEVRQILSDTSGVTLQDNVADNVYPTPKTAHGKDDVFVGRVRRDESFPNSLHLWIVSDNLRKGAATNAVQIAKYVAEKFNASK
jgi:aspartate-semialdehyde dehydrogenase